MTLLQSVEVARRMGDDASLSQLLLQLSAKYLEAREPGKSLAAAEEAIAAARRTGDSRREAWGLSAAGNALYGMGRFSRALENFLPAVSLMRESGDRFGEATSLKDAGIILKYLRRYDEAFNHLNEALKIFRELDEKPAILSTLHNIGVGYALLGADRQALEAFEEAIRVAREANDLTGACHVLIRIGYLVRSPELALQYLKEALDLAVQLKLFNLQIEALNGMSGALAETGKLDQAIEARKQALQINQALNRRMAVELNGLGHLFLTRDPIAAVDYFQRSLEAARSESDSPNLISPHHGLGEAFRRQGELDQAIEHYQLAVDATESIRTQLSSDLYRATFSGKHQHVYSGLIDALIERHEKNPQSGDDRRAFMVLEQARARTLVEAIAEGRVTWDDGAGGDWGPRGKELNARIALLQKRLIQRDVGDDERRELSRLLNEAEQEFERLKVEMKTRNPEYAALSYPAPLRVEDAQRLLDGRTAIVAYLVTEERVFVFIVTSTMFRAERLPIRAGIVRARVQNYVDLIAREDTVGWQEVSRCLHSDLVAPVRRLLSPEIDRLVVIPDDALHYLAFETLVQDQDCYAESPNGAAASSSKYLLEDFTISYAPSATVLAELEEHAASAETGQTDVAVFADPQLAPVLLAEPQTPGSLGRSLYEEEGLQVNRIPFSATEAQLVGSYGGAGSRIYTGAEASESRIKAEQLDRFGVIHFATHGLISRRMPARSALVLTPGGDDDGFLQLREIYQLKLRSDLVVLSACQTARGQLLGGDGVRGLAQAFIHAGASSVLASLWDVNDERASAFMETFYRHLAERKPKAEALRAAKLELIRRDPASSPRQWAAFILIGEADGIIAFGNGPIGNGVAGKMQRSGSWLIAGAVCSIFALAAFILIRRRLLRRAGQTDGSAMREPAAGGTIVNEQQVR
jgi:CHAT domain-containing protein